MAKGFTETLRRGTQLLQVTVCPHRDSPPNANESLSGRSYSERAYWKDVDRAEQTVRESYET